MKTYLEFINEQNSPAPAPAAPAPAVPAPSAPAAPAPAPAPAAPAVPAPSVPAYKPPVQNPADYTGYSEEGIAADKKAETELQTWINSSIAGIDEIYKNYSQNPQQGIKMLEQKRQEVDGHLTPNMKSAQRYPTIYDLFFHKYNYYKTILTNPTKPTSTTPAQNPFAKASSTPPA